MLVLGKRIVSTVDSMRHNGYAIEQRERSGDLVYLIKGVSYHIELTISPHRWVGLHLGLGTDLKRPTLVYDIDTDLYDLANPRFETFARSVEDEIVAFLESLVGGRVRIGKIGRKTALLIPMGTRVGIITQGRFAQSSRVRRVAASAEAKDGFVALT
jgi:hypothetical protein